MSRLFLSLLIIGSTLPQVHAQNINLADIQSRYPEDDAIILRQKEHLHIGQDSSTGELKVWLESETETLILNASNITFSNDAIFYTSFSTIENITAETLVPLPKNKYRVVPVMDFEEQDVMESGIFYSDHKRKKIVYPAVENGSVLRLHYEEHLNDARMLSPFFFDSYAPVLESEYTVTFPNSVELKYILYGQHTDQVQFEQSTGNGLTTYTWRAPNMPKFASEEDAPARGYYSPHIIVHIQRYAKDGQMINLLQDENDLYRWYYSLIQRMTPDDETPVKRITQDLIKDLGSDLDKAKAIFNWVQSNIQYIAFEDGMGGFIPRSAPSVCAKRYGDCKDMANLLCRMLNYAGLQAYLTWIGTRTKPYSYREVPTPIVDNHMITTLILDGQTYFLDATGKYTPFPLPTPMIQGKEAMIGLGEDRFEIKKVPVVEKEQNLLIDTSWLKILETDVGGKASRYAKGFFQLDLDAKRNLIEEGDTDQFWNGYLLKGNNKFVLTDFSANSVSTDRVGGISIPYDFTLPGYARRLGNRILVNMHLYRRLQNTNIDLSKRQCDREFEFRYIQRDVNILELPEGYTANYLPKSISYRNDKFGFDIRYNQRDDKIILDKEIYINTLLLKQEDFNAWNEMVNQLVDAYREVVVLNKQ